MKFERKNAAFLAIDLQRAFCCEDGSVAVLGRDITSCRLAGERCIDLATAARAAGMPVIWTRLALKPDYSDGGLMMHELCPGLRQIGGIRAGTPDVDFMPGVNVDDADVVIDKIRNSAFYGTPLDAILRARRIDTLVVGGVTTSMCVESTVRDSGQRDIRTFVVRDACGDFAEQRHQASLEVMEFGFARIWSHNEALAAFAD